MDHRLYFVRSKKLFAAFLFLVVVALGFASDGFASDGFACGGVGRLGDGFGAVQAAETAALGSQSSVTQQGPSQASSLQEGFESFPSGELKQHQSRSGSWEVTEGGATVLTRFAKDGKRSLQLLGGAGSSVIWTPAENPWSKSNQKLKLSFWAERWTKRRPFRFRIFGNDGHRWKEIYKGDAEIRVGRSFLSRPTILIDSKWTKSIKFQVLSPPNSGVLLDQVVLSKQKKQRIVKVASPQFVSPVLIGMSVSPVARLQVSTSGSLEPKKLSRLSINGLSKDKIKSVQVFHSSSESFRNAQPISERVLVGKEGKFPQTLDLSEKSFLQSGKNYLWVAVEPRGDLMVGDSVSLEIGSLRIGSNRIEKIEKVFSQNVGQALRKAGQDGVHTYRIPGLVRTDKGTLVAVYDIRRRGSRDLPGDIDVGVSRSKDGGKTWLPMQVAIDMGDDPKWQYEGVGDPSILVDEETGTIWIAALWSHGNRGWNGSGPGLKPEETGQLVLVKSEDDGKTWSKPVNITSQVKQKDWCLLLQGPGKGICMKDGTLVFPAQYQDAKNKKRLPHSTIIYSNDHGKSWKIGRGAFADTTEAQVIELEPGKLMLNCRYNRSNCRVVMITEDLGKTWKEHSTSRLSLIEPRACMASLIDSKEFPTKQNSWLLFSNPNNEKRRSHITIKASNDRGKTWPAENRLLLDQGTGRGYSCMAMIDKNTVGILYEGSGADLVFQRIDLRSIRSNPSRKQDQNTGDTKKESSQTSKHTLSIAQCFGSHMVLQAGQPLTVWGKSNPNSFINLQIGARRQKCQADSNGNWEATFPPFDPSKKPVCLTVSSKASSITLENILFGQVWICAGQSNMEWPLSKSGETSWHSDLPRRSNVRAYYYNKNVPVISKKYTKETFRNLNSKRYGTGVWLKSDSKTVSKLSAVAWHFGCRLNDFIDQPIGLICPAVGGTPTEAWVSKKTISDSKTFSGLLEGSWLTNSELSDFCKLRGRQNLSSLIQEGIVDPEGGKGVMSGGPSHPFKPGFMFESRIRPLSKLKIAGVIWYQGESNAETMSRVDSHQALFSLLVHSWRNQFARKKLPFLFVQLPAMNRPYWPAFRQTQLQAAKEIAECGMIVSIDTGSRNNVHPKGKDVIGHRLAVLAHQNIYSGKPWLSVLGPTVDRFEKKANGAVLVQYQGTGGSLVVKEAKTVRHFELARSDGRFFPADATLHSKKQILVSAKGVSNPMFIRYAWKPFPEPSVNLFNQSGFPASPFLSKIH